MAKKSLRQDVLKVEKNSPSLLHLNNFSKKLRLLSKEDFEYLQDKSKRFVSNSLILYTKTSRHQSGQTRIGISVSKKVGNSVCRNRIKRILREEFRLSQFKNMNVDVLLVVRNTDESGLKKDFHRLFPTLSC